MLLLLRFSSSVRETEKEGETEFQWNESYQTLMKLTHVGKANLRGDITR